MKRDMIHIDEEKCDGCGACIPNCPEGAIQVIDGKARLVGEALCDGLGACVGFCPRGAMTVEKREAQEYDERRVMANILRQGINVVAAHLKHLEDHGETAYLKEARDFLKEKGVPVPDYAAPAGAPGRSGATRDARPAAGHAGPSASPHHAAGPAPGAAAKPAPATATCRGWKPPEREAGGAQAGRAGSVESQLRQWPVQLKLVPAKAPYFKDAHILIAADCVPFAHGGFHEELLKDKAAIVFCPKLDDGVDGYVEKLAQIFKLNNVKSITVAHMEVPCCFGTDRVIEAALAKSGMTIPVESKTISVQGDVIETRPW